MAFHDDFGNDVVNLTTMCTRPGTGHPATFTETGGYLQLKTGGWAGEYQNFSWSNPTEITTYMFAYTGIPSGYDTIVGWSAITCLSYFDIAASYGCYAWGQQGLMIGNDTPWNSCRIEWGYDNDGIYNGFRSKRSWVGNGHVTWTNESGVHYTPQPAHPSTTPLYLRVDYLNATQTIDFYFGTNGIDWTHMYGPVNTNFIPTRIGLWAGNAGCLGDYCSVSTGRYTDLWVNPIGAEPAPVTGCSLPPMDGNFTLNHYYCLRNQFTNLNRLDNPTVAPFALANPVGNLREQIGGKHVSGSLD